MRASLFTLLCVFAAAYSQSHDLTLGQVSYGDVIIYKFNEYRYGIPLMTRTSYLDFPPSGLDNTATIRAIYVKDHDKDGNGGLPSVEAGGIGQKFVRLKFKSMYKGYGYNFTVTIHGKY